MILARPQRWRPADWLKSFLLFMLLSAVFIPSLAFTQEAPPSDTRSVSNDLLLGVLINDHPTAQLANFKILTNGKLAAAPADLRVAGIKPETGTINRDGLIPLDSLKNVTWHYDEAAQLLSFYAPDEALVPHEVNLAAGRKKVDLSRASSDFGIVLNYSLYGSSSYGNTNPSSSAFGGALDGRVVGPLGVISTSALARGDFLSRWGGRDSQYARLDSSWSYTDPESVLTYQIGDGISGSLPWSSSYRFGGIQIRRNFDIRPDLVTTPSPDLSGSVAVPSTLDLYLNNIHLFSGSVPAGPFDFSGLPVLGGGGNARIVVKDEFGRQTVTERPYYFPSDLLQPGLVDFSAELGYVRIGYGDASFDYDSDLVGSASVRYGVTDWLTLEGHVEATRKLANVGLGAVLSFGPYGVLRGAFNPSRYAAQDRVEAGNKISAFYQIGREGYSFYAGVDHMFGKYNDVALVADRKSNHDTPLSVGAREVLRTGISFPVPFDSSSLSIGYNRIRATDKRDSSQLISASWSRTIFDRSSIYVTAYSNIDKRNEMGIFAGLTVPIGDNRTAAASVSSSNNDLSYTASISQSRQIEEGSVGWTAAGRKTAGGESQASASVTYRNSLAEISASAEQSTKGGQVSLGVDGAVVIAGGDAFLANRVNDGFAIVKSAGPNVGVLVNGTRVATTNSRGRAFVPNIRPYQENRVSIDPENLDLSLQLEDTEALVVTADRSGAVVDFGARKTEAAVVILVGASGKPLPVGSVVRSGAGSEPTVVGYDGRTYLDSLERRNEISVELPDGGGTCRATFTYHSGRTASSEIGPIPCS